MEKNLKKMLKAMFYPLVLVRREYIKHRNVRWAEHQPMLLANYYYKNVMGHDINWSNPIDLNEKINWLKFKTDTSIWTTLADKYLVRNYIEEKGLGHLLPKLYGVWDNADDIDFEKLPNQFALKTNHGCGTVILVKDKSTIDYASVRKQMNHWLTIRFGLETVEPHYLAIKPLITAEELLVPNGGGDLLDYKLFMANGKTQIILVCSERKINVGCKLSLYDKNWNFIPEKLAGAHSRDEVSEIKKPVTLNQMIEAAEILAKDFPQVRVDFYEVNGKLFFGEMTFTSQGGYMNYIHPDELTRIGKLITLPIQ